MAAAPSSEGIVASMRVTGRGPVDGRRGAASIGRWRVDDAAAAHALYAQRRWSPDAEGHPLPAGDYTVLAIGGAYSMCDAPFTLRNYVPFVEAARGDILLTGLGLGCLVQGLLARPAVRSVTVLEIEAGVLDLVGPSVRDARVETIHADALSWRPAGGGRFDAAMLDIDDDARLVARLALHHAPWVNALWPDPAHMTDVPLGPDLAHLVASAQAAVT
jgi:hypothetical protein